LHAKWISNHNSISEFDLKLFLNRNAPERFNYGFLSYLFKVIELSFSRRYGSVATAYYGFVV
jgi:hypothetical protein